MFRYFSCLPYWFVSGQLTLDFSPSSEGSKLSARYRMSGIYWKERTIYSRMVGKSISILWIFCKWQKALRTPCSSFCSASCPDSPSIAFLSHRVHTVPQSVLPLCDLCLEKSVFLFEILWLCRSCMKSVSLFVLSQNSDSSSEPYQPPPPPKISKRQGSLIEVSQIKNKNLNNANKMKLECLTF